MTTLDVVDGLSVQSGDFSGFDDGRFAGGILYWEAEPGRIEKRGIDQHVGSQLVLTDQILDLTAGVSVIVSPGCAHDPTDCKDFYNNFDNYGGWPDLPEKNPFGSNSVF